MLGQTECSLCQIKTRFTSKASNEVKLRWCTRQWQHAWGNRWPSLHMAGKSIQQLGLQLGLAADPPFRRAPPPSKKFAKSSTSGLRQVLRTRQLLLRVCHQHVGRLKRAMLSLQNKSTQTMKRQTKWQTKLKRNNQGRQPAIESEAASTFHALNNWLPLIKKKNSSK